MHETRIGLVVTGMLVFAFAGLHLVGCRQRPPAAPPIDPSMPSEIFLPPNRPSVDPVPRSSGESPRWSSSDDNRICSLDGWCWEHPLPQGNLLMAVWGTRDAGLYVVGNQGTILNAHGDRWRYVVGLGSETNFTSVWGSSPDDIYAGWGGGIVHFNGTSWERLVLPEGAQATSIHGASSTLFVVSANTVFIRRRDDEVWNRGPTSAQHLNNVWARSATDAFVVGDRGVVLHFDGRLWTALTTGTNNNLYAVWGGLGDDVFAAGGEGCVIRYNGRGWTTILNESLGRIVDGFVIDGYVHVVDQSGLVLRFDGASWSTVVTASPEAIVSAVFVEGRGVVAVGAEGSLLWLDGQQWRSRSEGGLEELFDVWGADASHVFAVGDRGTILSRDGEGRWRTMPSGTDRRLDAIWGAGANDIYAVGGEGTILHFDGRAWTPMVSGVTSSLFGIWGSGPGDAYAVGSEGVILHLDGSSWTLARRGGDASLLDIWGRSPDDVFAVGERGIVLHWDGTQWERIDVGTGDALESVWGTMDGAVVVVGSRRTSLVSDDGRSWRPLLFNRGVVPVAVWGENVDDLFVGDGVGRVWRGREGQRTVLETGTVAIANSIWGTGACDVFLVGQRGMILHRRCIQTP